MDLNRRKRALIIGAGVAGPVLALFFKQAEIECELFEASPTISDSGGALGIAANGMNVLQDAGVAERLRDVSVTAGSSYFENQSGRLLALVPPADQRRYGQTGIMITRTALHRCLVQCAERQGIPVHYGKRLTHIQDPANQPVVAFFADGSSAEGDLIIGADGIGSNVRQAVIPEAARPVYTGLMALSGFSPCRDKDVLPRSLQPVHFIFGQKGFFGYFNTVTPDGPRTIWWSTFSAPLAGKDEVKRATPEELQQRLMALHGDWASPVPDLIAASPEVKSAAIHDVPSLPGWSAGRTVLIGDAAHAVAPHSGQGASMALEDAQFLARLLRETPQWNLPEIFRRFEQHRRPRTDRVIALGRRNGQRKEVLHPVAYWIQQQIIRVAVPLTLTRGQDWLLGYKVATQPTS